MNVLVIDSIVLLKNGLKVPGIILFRTIFTNPKRRYLLFK